ncbi:hypothetical protein BU26DRAFT_525036 [Trematosphaeria pertusa]|uniref:Uncharacterized protein n=1 Tax=Trematosphaeria pertusa TaxID=390896 RepID=A0A6A6HVR9_9PLEO|nr:uncharacterized protein BU26DRAFT_525036 [Trematosphaeria pertusa]KAF2241510.1 hypothetical protein BU26DRAFT_525036 [Trematosphaeria pertusa]
MLYPDADTPAGIVDECLARLGGADVAAAKRCFQQTLTALQQHRPLVARQRSRKAKEAFSAAIERFWVAAVYASLPHYYRFSLNKLVESFGKDADVDIVSSSRKIVNLERICAAWGADALTTLRSLLPARLPSEPAFNFLEALVKIAEAQDFVVFCADFPPFLNDCINNARTKNYRQALQARGAAVVTRADLHAYYLAQVEPSIELKPPKKRRKTEVSPVELPRRAPQASLSDTTDDEIHVDTEDTENELVDKEGTTLDELRDTGSSGQELGLGDTGLSEQDLGDGDTGLSGQDLRDGDIGFGEHRARFDESPGFRLDEEESIWNGYGFTGPDPTDDDGPSRSQDEPNAPDTGFTRPDPTDDDAPLRQLEPDQPDTSSMGRRSSSADDEDYDAMLQNFRSSLLSASASEACRGPVQYLIDTCANIAKRKKDWQEARAEEEKAANEHVDIVRRMAEASFPDMTCDASIEQCKKKLASMAALRQTFDELQAMKAKFDSQIQSAGLGDAYQVHTEANTARHDAAEASVRKQIQLLEGLKAEVAEKETAVRTATQAKERAEEMYVQLRDKFRKVQQLFSIAGKQVRYADVGRTEIAPTPK